LLVLIAASCDATHPIGEGTVVAGVTSNDHLLVGELQCKSQTFVLPDEAVIWRVTGNRDEPLALLWRGRRGSTTPTVAPASGLELFSAYEFVEGPLGPVTDLRSVADDVELDVVLVLSGGADLVMSTARAHRDAYSFRGKIGSFDELQRSYCAPAGT
jgi:hypothetical protein